MLSIISPKEKKDFGKNIFWLTISIIFILTTFILIKVTTAGSVLIYTPSTNVHF